MTRPVINAAGIYTDLGGSRLSPVVWARMEAANRAFTPITDLLDDTGRRLAGLLGAEAARVTSGATAGIALATAAAITRGDRPASARLPETDGLPNQVLVQVGHHYSYLGAIGLAGGRVRMTDDLASAIGPETAALFVPAHLDGAAGTRPLADVIALGRTHDVPVLVDAAYLCWPLETIPALVRLGADAVIASAKYFGGPNGGGFVAGRRGLVDGIVANEFTRHESGPYRKFGRAYKLDRSTVVAVVAAYEEWLAADHGARWGRYASWADAIVARVGRGARPAGFTMDERVVAEPVNAVEIRLTPGTGPRLGEALAAGTPPIRCIVEPDRLVCCLDVIADEEVGPLAERLAAVLEADR